MKSRKTAIATMFALYGLVAFVTTLAAPLATVWKAQPEIAGSNALAMLGEAKTEVNIVPAPATPSEEQEILAEANIHRSTPEELRTEVKLAQRAWNTMAKERRAKLREEYLQRFKAASAGIPAYDADPDRYISANFRPVHD